MVAGILVITKQEVMADITVAVMLPKIEPNVFGVMTNDKPKQQPIKVFESSDGQVEFYLLLLQQL